MTTIQRNDFLTLSVFKENSNVDPGIISEKLSGGVVVLVDKPVGWTSFDVVNKIKKTFAIKKVGHAGTLDPMATGLLIVCTARKTKEIDSFVSLEKTYTGTIKLGETTASYDAETEVIDRKPIDTITPSMVIETTGYFIGEIEQLPPMYSAIKKNGKPLYKLARKGIEVKREPRRVSISEFSVTDINLPYVSFKITCSKGTYIRSIAHDFGQKLNTGGHLTDLRRIAIGPYTVDEAVTIELVNELKDRLKRKYV